jgi:hypothetical protein
MSVCLKLITNPKSCFASTCLKSIKMDSLALKLFSSAPENRSCKSFAANKLVFAVQTPPEKSQGFHRKISTYSGPISIADMQSKNAPHSPLQK